MTKIKEWGGGKKRTKWGGKESNVGKKENKVGVEHREERGQSWGGDGGENRGEGVGERSVVGATHSSMRTDISPIRYTSKTTTWSCL